MKCVSSSSFALFCFCVLGCRVLKMKNSWCFCLLTMWLMGGWVAVCLCPICLLACQEHCLRIFWRDDVKGVQATALKPLTVLLEWSISQLKQPPNFSMDWGLTNVLIVEFWQAKSHGTCA
jgi:hypothetical protein